MTTHRAPDNLRPDATPGTRGRRVLVVDDDPLNLELLRLRLGAAGFDVVTAETGEEALNAAVADRPDAVLSDIQMPGMDGWQLRRAFQQDARLARIPVVLISSALPAEGLRRPDGDPDWPCVTRSEHLDEAVEALATVLGDGMER